MGQDILSEGHIKAIGELVVATSKLDSVVTDLISVFLETDIVRTVVTVHHQQFASKIDNLLALARIAFGESADTEFAEIIGSFNKARAVGDFRNTVVHAMWTVDTNGVAHAVRFESRGKFTRKRRPVDASEIQARADEALALTRTLAAFRDHMRAQEALDR